MENLNKISYMRCINILVNVENQRKLSYVNYGSLHLNVAKYKRVLKKRFNYIFLLFLLFGSDSAVGGRRQKTLVFW